MEATDWEQAYRRYYKPIFSFVYARLRCYEDARDVVADTFVRAISAEQRGSGNRYGLEAWLWQVARSTLIDYYRKPHVRRKVDCLEEAPDAEDECPTPHAEAEASVLWDALCRAAKLLTPEQREVMDLYMRGYTQTEIGEQLGVRAGTIKSRVFRAQATLRLLVRP